jgi:nitrogen fixation NifU-like protein
MVLKYSKKVIEHFKNPRNVGIIEDADAIGEVGSPVCGDVIVVYLKIDEKTKKIVDIKFQSFGCASNIATASVMTELVKGLTIEEAKKFDWKKIYEELDQLPPTKIHCSVLAVDGLKKAIENWEIKKGLKKVKSKSLKEKIIEELNKIIHPTLKKGLVDLNEVELVEKGNKFLVKLNIGENEEEWEEFFINEINEHLSPLKISYEVKINKIRV